MINRVDMPLMGISGLTEKTQQSSEVERQSFKDIVMDQMNQIAENEKKVDESITELITGDVENIHEVLIETEEARLQLELAVQVRNKVVEAYQEIMRMQV